jgi:hypothetical protein
VEDLHEGWLNRQLETAAKEVKEWPVWMRSSEYSPSEPTVKVSTKEAKPYELPVEVKPKE